MSTKKIVALNFAILLLGLGLWMASKWSEMNVLEGFATFLRSKRLKATEQRRTMVRAALEQPGGIGLGAAVDYLNKLGMDNVHEYEQFITNYALEALSDCKPPVI